MDAESIAEKIASFIGMEREKHETPAALQVSVGDAAGAAQLIEDIGAIRLSDTIEKKLGSMTLADVMATDKERKPRAGGAGARPCGKSFGRKADKR